MYCDVEYKNNASTISVEHNHCLYMVFIQSCTYFVCVLFVVGFFCVCCFSKLPNLYSLRFKRACNHCAGRDLWLSALRAVS